VRGTIGWIGLVGLSLLGAGCGGREEPAAEPDTAIRLPDYAAIPGRLKESAPPAPVPPTSAQPVAFPSEPDSSPIEREAVRKARGFTALVEVSTVKDGNPAGTTGTACCIDRSGLFVTHAKLVEDVTQEKGQVRLIFDDEGPTRRVRYAKLRRTDERSNLALLELIPDPELKFETLALAGEADAAVGLEVDAFGYPHGDMDVATARHARPGDDAARFKFNYGHPYYFQLPALRAAHGRVAQVSRDRDRIALLLLEYDGNSGPQPGAPVLDRSGRLIGVAGPSIFGGRYTHSAVPAGEVAALLKGVRSAADQARADAEHFEVLRRGKKATALVEADTNRGKVSGSAFCIDRSGLFITNAHVVKGARDIRLVLEIGEPGQRVVQARALRRDDVLDLALLQGDARSVLEPLEVARDAELYPTMRVVTFGFPFGILLAFEEGDHGKFPEVTISVSRVTALRTSAAPERVERVQFDGQLNPGNSGGPVLDAHGKVVGVATAAIRGAAINFAVPADRLSGFLKAPALDVDAPAITWDKRAAPSTWRITVVPPTPTAALPQGLAVAVTVDDGVGKPRRFWADPAGRPGDFKVEFVPVPRDRGRQIKVAMRVGDGIQTMDLEEIPVKVNGREFRLGDLYHVSLAPSRWVYTVEQALIRGRIDGLGEVEAQVYGPTPGPPKPKRVDLGRASELSVVYIFQERPVRSLEVTIKAMEGGRTGRVVAGYIRRAAIPGATAASRTGRVAVGPAWQVATRLSLSPGQAEPESRLELGGDLDVVGTPRGSARSIRPPRVDMGGASVYGGSQGGPGSRAIHFPDSVRVVGAAFSRDGTLVALSCVQRSPAPAVSPRPGAPVFQRQRVAAGVAEEVLTGTIRIFDVATGREVQTLDQGEAGATELAYSPDGSRLLAWPGRGGPTGAAQGLVAWDIKTGRHSPKSREPLFAEVDGLKIAPDGRRVLTYDLGSAAVIKTLRLCDAETGKVLRSYESILDPLYNISGDWKRIVTFHYRPEDAPRPGQQARRPYELSAYRYRVVELETGRVLAQGNVEARDKTVLNPDPSTLALYTQDDTVVLRDMTTGSERRRFRLNPFRMSPAAGVLGLTPDGKHFMGEFVSGRDGGQPGDIALFSSGTGQEEARLKTGPRSGLSGGPISGWAISPSGNIAAILGTGECWLWTIGETSGRPRAGAAQRPTDSPLVRWMEGKIRDVAVGGGGRYLALTLQEARKVAVFDANAADVVKTIPLASEDALVAAGATKLVIAYPGARRLERWDLPSLRRDGEVRPAPIDGVLHAVAMGHDSDGPLLALWSARKDGVRFSFIDLDSLKVLRVSLVSAPRNAPDLSRSGGSFLANSSPDATRVCASAGGQSFGAWGSGPFALRADGNVVNKIMEWPHYGAGGEYLIPGADGTSLFTFSKGIIADPRSADGPANQGYVPPEEPMFPSPDPVYCLSLRGGGSISIRLAADNARLLNVTGLDEMLGLPGTDRSLVSDRIGVEKRFHLVPAANLLVTIPTSNDRLVLRRLDIGESLARLPGEFLFVTSPPILAAKAGQPLRRRIVVQSRLGGVTWALDRGPKGLTLSTDGLVSWPVPRGLKGTEETATVTIGDASGRRVVHKLTIHVE
jgi:S1-C subfamily serine protease